MSVTAKAPKTVGPNLMEMTIREQAALAWETKTNEARRKAERAATNLARTIFGNIKVEFDDFIPEGFLRRHRFSSHQSVTFEVEGLEFNYVAANSERGERFYLLDACPCGRGPRILGTVNHLGDIARIYSYDLSDVECLSCVKDKKDT